MWPPVVGFGLRLVYIKPGDLYLTISGLIPPFAKNSAKSSAGVCGAGLSHCQNSVLIKRLDAHVLWAYIIFHVQRNPWLEVDLAQRPNRTGAKARTRARLGDQPGYGPVWLNEAKIEVPPADGIPICAFLDWQIAPHENAPTSTRIRWTACRPEHAQAA
ncbi:hypothetical protein [Propionivibrio sp.]|uniref:hypothetical protein n=1 Tax=Propionivibrio sp. TaxID=2212460 RepID=UPI0025F7D997|nr:hypothetical protein [Propionivibrio sp.]MBK7357447.1 hypothetical protein [Propionivibrio sp.]